MLSHPALAGHPRSPTVVGQVVDVVDDVGDGAGDGAGDGDIENVDAQVTVLSQVRFLRENSSLGQKRT